MVDLGKNRETLAPAFPAFLAPPPSPELGQCGASEVHDILGLDILSGLVRILSMQLVSGHTTNGAAGSRSDFNTKHTHMFNLAETGGYFPH